MSDDHQNLIPMPRDFEPDKIEPGQPEHMIVKLEAILEPKLPARCSMSDADMDELMESLEALGQLQPVELVRSGEMFELIDGHRRFLAARALNAKYASKGELRWTCIRAEVYPEGHPHVLAARLHANIIREQLNPAEEAVYMRQALEEMHLDLPGLARLFHRSENYINSRVALLRGYTEVFEAVAAGKLNLGAAHQLNRIDDDTMRASYLDCALKTNPPAGVVETWVREWKKLRPHMAQREMQKAEPLPHPEPLVIQRACVFCGGYLDQQNLIEITVHVWEWKALYREMFKREWGEGNGQG